MFRYIFKVYLTFALITLPLAAAAERIALIIGNAAYEHLGELDNTLTDAGAYREALESLGFEVDFQTDLSLDGMLDAQDRLIARIRPGDEVAFVYSGHGWSDGTTNYLIPTDAPHQERDRQLVRASIALRNGFNGILDEIEGTGARLTVAIIDACRNNPFKPPPGTRSTMMTRGLAPLVTANGTFVIFSAGTGQLALDGLPDDPEGDTLSVFTRTFVPKLKGGLYLEDAIAQAQLETAQLALNYGGHLQHPAYYDQTLGKTCLAERCSADGIVEAAHPAPTTGAEPAAEVEPEQSDDIAAFKPTEEVASPEPVEDVETPEPAAESPEKPQRPLAEMANSEAVAACDRIAQHPAHPDIQAGRAFGDGIHWRDMDEHEAERQCRDALREFPEHPRLLAALGRSLQKQERFGEARLILERAIALNDPVAMTNLGLMYEESRGVTRNYNEAARLFRMAADIGYSPAQTQMGVLHRRGTGVRRDDREAARWYKLAAAQDNARAQAFLGWMYSRGQGVEKNDAEAVRLMRLSASAAHADGLFNLGWMYRRGQGVQQNDRWAVRLFHKAAQLGHPAAQNSLGWMHYNGYGVAQSDAAAVAWYRLAAEAKNVPAMRNMGLVYRNGRGVRKDAAESLRWYERAANQGDAETQFELGLAYADGEHVPAKDLAKAAEWYRKAADLGYDKAQNNLALLYSNGSGVVADPLEAARLFALSAEQGNRRAANNLTNLLKDRSKARRVQEGLRRVGSYRGRIDGVFGAGSRAALGRYCECDVPG